GQRVTSEALQPGCARVWCVRTDGPGLPGLPGLDDQLQVLSEAERALALRLAGDDHRRDFIHSHALLRRALSACAPDVPAAAWDFTTTDSGRPEVAGPFPHLSFSLSHTDGVVACVVAADAACGIDVEAHSAGTTVASRRVLTEPEHALLRQAAPAEASVLYARLWTLKEAYAKARGLGLLLPFDQLEVTLADPPTLLDRTTSAPSGPWHLEQWPAAPHHVAALAIAGTPRSVVHSSSFPA
ncbi:MAG: 4-phosphopantetheinyl transferase, partial [Frankiaceae bacterium]|nr:4-phosphopantetheinyl transferase [Frankiaceae bacterium]